MQVITHVDIFARLLFLLFFVNTFIAVSTQSSFALFSIQDDMFALSAVFAIPGYAIFLVLTV